MQPTANNNDDAVDGRILTIFTFTSFGPSLRNALSGIIIQIQLQGKGSMVQYLILSGRGACVSDERGQISLAKLPREDDPSDDIYVWYLLPTYCTFISYYIQLI